PVLFFFSGGRRGTRCARDWSSDVCSSDLPPSRSLHSTPKPGLRPRSLPGGLREPDEAAQRPFTTEAKTMAIRTTEQQLAIERLRSEERRVGQGGCAG